MDFTLYHYFEESEGPLRNLSALPIDESAHILEEMKKDSARRYAAQRPDGYMERRIELEGIIRNLFIEKGGKPEKTYPHYFVVGKCPWFDEWYSRTSSLSKQMSEINPDTVSFTYGDSFPTFSDRVNDGREYRKQVYTYDEICRLI